MMRIPRTALVSVLLARAGALRAAPARPRSAGSAIRAVSDWTAIGATAAAAERFVGDCGFEAPTAIQAASFEALRAGRDGVIHAETGSGKTLAWSAPLAGRAVLVLAPGNALVRQIRRAVDAAHAPGDAARFVVATPKALLASAGGAGDFDAVVLEECDALLRPSSKYATAAAKAKIRERPAAKCLRRLLERRPATQVVASSATVGRPLRRAIDRCARRAGAEKPPIAPLRSASESIAGKTAGLGYLRTLLSRSNIELVFHDS